MPPLWSPAELRERRAARADARHLLCERLVILREALAMTRADNEHARRTAESMLSELRVLREQTRAAGASADRVPIAPYSRASSGNGIAVAKGR
jgi:hypothetical protein